MTKEDVYHPQIDEGSFIIRGGSQVLYNAHVAVYINDNRDSRFAIQFLKNRYEIIGRGGGDIKEEITDFIKAWYTLKQTESSRTGTILERIKSSFLCELLACISKILKNSHELHKS